MQCPTSAKLSSVFYDLIIVSPEILHIHGEALTTFSQAVQSGQSTSSVAIFFVYVNPLGSFEKVDTSASVGPTTTPPSQIPAESSFMHTC